MSPPSKYIKNIIKFCRQFDNAINPQSTTNLLNNSQVVVSYQRTLTISEEQHITHIYMMTLNSSTAGVDCTAYLGFFFASRLFAPLVQDDIVANEKHTRDPMHLQLSGDTKC